MKVLSFKEIFQESIGIKILKSSIFIVLFIYILNIVSCTKVHFDSIHKTKEAQEKVDDLYCYACDYMDQAENCENINKTKNSNLTKKCHLDEYMCMVKRFSYTTSTENTTSEKKLWSLQRNCTNKCESGCIVIGERTKLYACTYCCNSSLCNTTSGTSRIFKENRVLLIEVLLIIVLLLPNFN